MIWKPFRRNIRNKCAAGVNVNDLETTTNTKQGQAVRQGVVDQPQFKFIAPFIDTSRAQREKFRMVIEPWVNVFIAAAEQQAVAAFDIIEIPGGIAKANHLGVRFTHYPAGIYIVLAVVCNSNGYLSHTQNALS